MVPLWPDLTQLPKVRETGSNWCAEIILHNTADYFFKSNLPKLLNTWIAFSFIINLFLESVFILSYYIHIVLTKICFLWSTHQSVFSARSALPDARAVTSLWLYQAQDWAREQRAIAWNSKVQQLVHSQHSLVLCELGKDYLSSVYNNFGKIFIMIKWL